MISCASARLAFSLLAAVLAQGPWAKALEVARRAGLTAQEELEYEREKMAEQDYRGGLSLTKKQGEARAGGLKRRWRSKTCARSWASI